MPTTPPEPSITGPILEILLQQNRILAQAADELIKQAGNPAEIQRILDAVDQNVRIINSIQTILVQLNAGIAQNLQ